MSTGKNVRRISWVYSILPINIALGPIGTFVQLYLLRVGGNHEGTLYVAAAVTAFNAVSIPAAVIWGLVTDRVRGRKVIVIVSYLLTTVFLFSFVVANSVTGTILVYSLVSFASSASATPLDLLVMETQPKNRWASGFAKLSLVSSIGVAAGYVLSAVWAQFLPLEWLLVLLGILSGVSVMMSQLLIQEPAITFEREVAVIDRPLPLPQRLLAVPLIFLKIPRLYDFRKIFKGLRNELTSYVPLLYISIVCFYLSAGLFNTSLVPALTSHSLSDSEVYVVNVVAMIATVVAYRYAGPFIAKRSLTGVAVQSLILRGSCYALLGVAAFIPGVLYIVPALILFPLSSGIAYGLYYTASNTLIFNSVHGRNQGSTLGVYSAVVGVSTTVGSLTSGAISIYLGFETTFIIAGGILGVAAVITARLSNKDVDEEPQASAPYPGANAT
jgi:MFS family permease